MGSIDSNPPALLTSFGAVFKLKKPGVKDAKDYKAPKDDDIFE